MLQQLLEQLGVTNFENLTAEERKTYQEWAKVLTTKDATVEDIQRFVSSELTRASDELLKIGNTKERELFFKVMVRMLTALKLMIETPRKQRDQLTAHLKQSFNIEI